MSQETTACLQSGFRKVKRRPTMQYFTYDQPFQLECGKSLPCLTLAYETYGTLSPKRDNVILIPHALTGDSHCASHFPGDELGWWEGFVGPGKAIDTDRYFVICSNVIGGCQGSTGPASIDPATGKPYGMRFPTVTINDMVRAQRELVRHLGIERIHAVIGGSMGGMQTLEWAVTFPEMVEAIVPIATPARSSPQSIAFNEVGRQAIKADPNWRGGDYYDGDGPERGLAIARMVGMITYQSDESMWQKFGRELMNASFDEIYSFSTQFQVESYLHYQGKKLVDRFDANTYIYLTRALDLFDLGWRRGGLKEALSRIRVPTLVVGISSDILYPTYQQKEIVAILNELGTDAQYAEIDCPYGHDGFLIEAAKMSDILCDFLQRIAR